MRTDRPGDGVVTTGVRPQLLRRRRPKPVALRLFMAIVIAAYAGCHRADLAEGGYAEGTPHVQARELVLGVSREFVDDDPRRVSPLREYLQERLGIPVRIRIADGNDDLPWLVAVGAIDAAQLPPLAYVRLRDRKAEVVPLLTPMVSATPTSLGHVYVRDDSPIQTLEELEGRTVAYVHGESSAGYLFPRALLRSRGFDPETFFSNAEMRGSRAAVIDAVLSGEVDAGAASDLSTEDVAGRSRIGHTATALRVVAKTARVPNDCLVVHSDYDAGARAALEKALLELRPGAPAAQRVLTPLGVNGWVRAEDRRYDVVRAIAQEENRLLPKAVGSRRGTYPRH